MYSARSFARPDGLANSSESPSTFTMIDGAGLLMIASLVAFVCRMLRTTSARLTPYPMPRYGASGSGRTMK